MASQTLTVSGVEQFFPEDDIIVSKTDLKGRITYANKVFMDIAGYTENELMGAPHSILRHPDMPRAVFQLLWDTVQGGNEIFAYVINRCANGDHYWVFAHVTPSFDAQGNIVGYHSSRRVPDRDKMAKVQPIYESLLAEEKRHANRKDGQAASHAMLVDLLKSNGVSYDEFIFSL